MTNKWRWIIRQFFICALLAPSVLLANTTTKLTALRFIKIDSATRIVMIFNQSVPAKIFYLEHPDRLVVDLTKTTLATKIKNANFHSKDIKSLRAGHPDPNTLRLVFDLNKSMRYKVASNPEDPALIIDLPTGPAALEPSLQQHNEKKPSVQTSAIKPALTKDHTFVVVIDPGHGGKDPGAVGEQGTKEKSVVLAIAKDLADKINQQPHMRAVLTRSGDYFVPLRDRLRLARKGNADLFIAIHADSYFNDHSSGASVYALSQHGATTEAARWLAQRENYSELGGVNLRGLGDQSYLLRSVLIDLAQTATITDSIHLGSSLLGTLSDVTRLHYPHVEQAPFVVLKSPDIPSILVETGFISNVDEEKRLRDPAYQKRVSLALFTGVQNYLKKYSAVGI